MFKISQQIEITMPNPQSMYWIAVTDNGDGTASADLVTRAGEWKPDKQGCYLPDGRRILNRFIQPKDGYVITPNVNDKVYEKLTPGSGSKDLRKGWYFFILQSGNGGVDGGDGSSQYAGSGGIAENGIPIF